MQQRATKGNTGQQQKTKQGQTEGNKNKKNVKSARTVKKRARTFIKGHKKQTNAKKKNKENCYFLGCGPGAP